MISFNRTFVYEKKRYRYVLYNPITNQKLILFLKGKYEIEWMLFNSSLDKPAELFRDKFIMPKVNYGSKLRNEKSLCNQVIAIFEDVFLSVVCSGSNVFGYDQEKRSIYEINDKPNNESKKIYMRADEDAFTIGFEPNKELTNARFFVYTMDARRQQEKDGVSYVHKVMEELDQLYEEYYNSDGNSYIRKHVNK